MNDLDVIKNTIDATYTRLKEVEKLETLCADQDFLCFLKNAAEMGILKKLLYYTPEQQANFMALFKKHLIKKKYRELSCVYQNADL